MLPPKDDPKWRHLVVGPHQLVPQALATKMIMTRVKMLVGASPTEDKIQEAITVAYEFFKKNEFIVVEDIKMIFKEGP